MKNKLMTVLLISMLIACIVLCAGCPAEENPNTDPKPDPVTSELQENLNKLYAENGRMDMFFSVGEYGMTMEAYAEFDGNLMFVEAEGEAYYVEIIENSQFCYMYGYMPDGTVVKEPAYTEDLLGNLDADEELVKLLADEDNYTYSEEEEVYVFDVTCLPEDFTQVEAATFAFDDEKVYFTVEYVERNMAMSVSVEIYDVGEVEIEIPEVSLEYQLYCDVVMLTGVADMTVKYHKKTADVEYDILWRVDIKDFKNYSYTSEIVIGENTYYFEIAEPEQYMYFLDEDNNWVRKIMSREEEVFTQMEEVSLFVELIYAREGVYDEETGKLIFEADEEYPEYEPYAEVYYDAEGNFVIYVEMVNEDGSITYMTWTFSDVLKTEITLPADYVDMVD